MFPEHVLIMFTRKIPHPYKTDEHHSPLHGRTCSPSCCFGASGKWSTIKNVLFCHLLFSYLTRPSQGHKHQLPFPYQLQRGRKHQAADPGELLPTTGSSMGVTASPPGQWVTALPKDICFNPPKKIKNPTLPQNNSRRRERGFVFS